MSDPVTNIEIEDVLSSIRRLVSEDTRKPPSEVEKPKVTPAASEATGKLVLTPALRIPEPDEATGAAADLPEQVTDESPGAGADEPLSAELPKRDAGRDTFVLTETAEPADNAEFAGIPADENPPLAFLGGRGAVAALEAEDNETAEADLTDDIPDTDLDAVHDAQTDPETTPADAADAVAEATPTRFARDGEPWQDPNATLYSAAVAAGHPGEDDLDDLDAESAAEPESDDMGQSGPDTDDTPAPDVDLAEEMAAPALIVPTDMPEASAESAEAQTDSDPDAVDSPPATDVAVAEDPAKVDDSAEEVDISELAGDAPAEVDFAEPVDDAPEEVAFAEPAGDAEGTVVDTALVDDLIETDRADPDDAMDSAPDAPLDEASSIPPDEAPAASDALDSLTAKIAAVESRIGRAEEFYEPDEPGTSAYAGVPVESVAWDESPETVGDGPTDVVADKPPGDAPGEEKVEADEARREAEEANADIFATDETILDEESLRELVADIVREELQGALGERITRNVRKLVRREIHRALAAKELD